MPAAKGLKGWDAFLAKNPVSKLTKKNAQLLF